MLYKHIPLQEAKSVPRALVVSTCNTAALDWALVPVDDALIEVAPELLCLCKRALDLIPRFQGAFILGLPVNEVVVTKFVNDCRAVIARIEK